MACERAGRAAAAHSVGDGFRLRDIRHALHGDGGATLCAFVPASSGAPAFSTDLLAIIVAIVAFCISGIFFLLLLPDFNRQQQQATAAVALGPSIVVEIPASPAPGDDPEFGRGTYSPLGGVGGPPPRFARHLPIEREGGTQFVAVEDVIAVHANAHYSYIFDGNDKLFCPLAIGDVELRLDKTRFIRVHRSHIINLDRVVGYKRSGDNDLVQMAGTQHYVVPVSRSRIGVLKSRVASLKETDPELGLRRRHRLAMH